MNNFSINSMLELCALQMINFSGIGIHLLDFFVTNEEWKAY
ncbi:hypothetical protein [uncultured Brachyspira sp.]|nr:hypothetical protein [uncultured Brachyspira sp.]